MNIFLKRFPKFLGLILALFFLSCEEDSGSADANKKNELGLGHYLNDAKTSYIFYIDSFIREDQTVYNVGNIGDADDDLQIPDIWGSVNVRWGFRKKPAKGKDTKIYWWQKATIDANTQNVFETEVAETKKAVFMPSSLPNALLNEESIEVYALVEVGGYKLSKVMDLPADFKERVLGASVIEGMIINNTAVQAKRTPTTVVGAAVFAVHEGTGTIFQGFSGSKGNYRITVSGRGTFTMTVLRNGFQPHSSATTVSGNKSGVDILVNEAANAFSAGQLYEVKTATHEAVNPTGYSVSGTAVDVGSGVKSIPGAFLLFYDRESDKTYFLQANSTGTYSTNLPVTAKEGEQTTLSVVGAAYGYVPQRGSQTIGAPHSASTLLNTVEFLPDSTIKGDTKLTWGPRSTGGPSDFSKESPIKLRYKSGGIAVKMYLIGEGLFVPSSPSVIWQIDNQVVSGESGMSATLSLRSEKRYTVSASFTDLRQKKVSLERNFDLDANYNADTEDPTVIFGEDTINGGTKTGTGNDENGNTKTSIAPDSATTSVSVIPKVKAVDPDTGTGEGLTYAWELNGAPAGTGTGPTIPLESGVNTVRLTVTSADGANSVTVTRTYVVGSGATTPGGGTSTGTLDTTPLTVKFGSGSSGGDISTLGTEAKPLRYSTKGSNQFTVTLKALVSGPVVGTLSYAWTLSNALTKQTITEGSTRTSQLEAFRLREGSYTISVTATDDGAKKGTASRSFSIVPDSSVALPTGTKGSWLASSSGGAGDLPDNSEKTTFRDAGGGPVAVRVASDITDPSGNPLTPVEWYVDGVLQEGIVGLDAVLNLPSGGGSSPTTRVVLAVGRGTGTNQEPVTMRRVFTLDPQGTKSPFGPMVRWGSSNLDPSQTQNFNGRDALQLVVDVVVSSAGSQTFDYEWKVNGNVVAGQKASTAILSLNRAGNNTVSIKVSNNAGSVSLTRTYKLNSLPTATVSTDKAGLSIGEKIRATATASDPDTGTQFSYIWKIKSPSETLWANIPGVNPQPTGNTFEFSTANLGAGTYTLQVTVSDGFASVIAISSFVLNAASGGPEIAWATGGLDPGKTHSFDSTRGLDLNLGVTVQNPNGDESYEWKLNGAVVATSTSDRINWNLNKVGTNTIDVKVSTSKGSALLQRSYILNTLPTLAVSMAETSLVAGKATVVNAVASDRDAGTRFSYVWKLQYPGSTNWVNIPNTTTQPTLSIFEFSTTGLASGTYKIQGTVSDGMGGSVSAEVSFSIVANSLPSLGDIQLPSELTNGGVLQVDSATPASRVGSFSVSASDPDGDPLTYIWRINGRLLQRGADLNSINIDYGIPAATNGANPKLRVISVEVEDSNGASVSKSVSFRVNHVPRASVTVGARKADGIPVSSTVTDADSDTALTYTWKFRQPGSSAWVVIPGMTTQPTTPSFTLPVSALNGGSRYGLQLTVSDGNGGTVTAETDFVLSNNSPTSSEIQMPTGLSNGGVLQVNSATPASRIGIFSISASDPDGDPLTYTWSINGKALHRGPNLNRVNIDYGIPAAANSDPKQRVFTVGIQDGKGGSVTKSASFRVNHVPSVSVTTGTRTAGSLPVSATVADVDSDTSFTYVWKFRQSASNAWASIPRMTTQPTTASFNLPVSSLNTNSRYGLQLTVSDGDGGSATAETDFTISNNAPTSGDIQMPTGLSDGGLLQVNSETSASLVGAFSISASDPDGDPLTYTWSINGKQLQSGTSLASINIDYGIPVATDATNSKLRTISVEVADGNGGSISKSVSFRVNHKPKVSITTGTKTAAGLPVSATASDIDSDTSFTYVWKLRQPGSSTWVNIPRMTTQPTTSSFILPVSGLNVGSRYALQLLVSDGAGGSATVETDFVVSNTEPTVGDIQMPTGLSNGGMLQVDSDIPVSRAGTFSVSASDPDGDTLTYTWSINGKVLQSGADLKSLNIEYGVPAATNTDAKQRVITLKVEDGNGGSITKTVSFRVNHKPKVTVATGTKTAAGLPVSATASDADSDTSFTYVWKFRQPGSSTWVNIPRMTTQPTASSFILPLSGLNSGSRYALQLAVSDGAGGTTTVETDFVVSNTEPTVGDIQMPTGLNNGGMLQVDSDIPVSRTGTFSVSASDPDGDTLTYTWSINGKQLQSSANLNSISIDYGVPAATNTDTKQREISVKVEDGNGASITKTVSFRVNHKPKVTIAIGTKTAAGIPVSATASDADSDTSFTYVWKFRQSGSSTWVNIPGMTTQPTASSFILPTSGLTVGSGYGLQLTISDGSGGTGTTEAALTIPANSPPVLGEMQTPVGVTNGGVLQLTSNTLASRIGTFSISASDPDGDALSYTWRVNGRVLSGASSASVSIDYGNPAILLTNSKQRSVSVSVSDGTNDAVNKGVGFKVNHPPAVTISIGSRNNAGFIPISTTVTDADGDTSFRYAWKFRRPGSTTWEAIPGVTNQPTASSFNLPTAGLLAGSGYRLQLTVTERFAGGSSTEEAALTIPTSIRGTVSDINLPEGLSEGGLLQLGVNSGMKRSGTFSVTTSGFDAATISYTWWINHVQVQSGADLASVNLNYGLPKWFVMPPYTRERRITVTVADGTGASVTKEASFRVNHRPSAVITIDPRTDTHVPIAAETGDVDAGESSSTYVWKFRESGSTTWGDLPGMASQPTTKSFDLPVAGLTAGSRYFLQLTFSDTFGTSVTVARDFVLASSAQDAVLVVGNRGPIWQYDFLKLTVPIRARLAKNLREKAGVTYTYAWQFKTIDENGAASTWGSLPNYTPGNTAAISVNMDVVDPGINSLDPTTVPLKSYYAKVTIKGSDGSTYVGEDLFFKLIPQVKFTFERYKYTFTLEWVKSEGAQGYKLTWQDGTTSTYAPPLQTVYLGADATRYQLTVKTSLDQLEIVGTHPDPRVHAMNRVTESVHASVFVTDTNNQ